MNAEQSEEHPADYGSDDAENDVHRRTVAAAFHDLACCPSGNQADHDPPNQREEHNIFLQPDSLYNEGLKNDTDRGPRARRGLFRISCLNQFMFARKIRVEYEENGKRLPCPLKWLDSFSMRNFTNVSVFDDTLPVSDGRIEIGSAVSVEDLRAAMQDWFQRKGYLPKDSHLVLADG